MNRIQALLAAGALTGLVIVAIFWYGTIASAAPETTTSTTAGTATITAAPVTPTAPDESATADTQSLRAQNQQLRETVTTLLKREEEYRRQIETANQQLLALQTPEANDGNGNAWFFQNDDDEAYEDEENEHEEYEHSEHERNENEHDEHEEDDD